MSQRVCIIPARGGSQRVPHKNRKLFHGRPIIEYSIQAAQESCMFDKIVVSSDDQSILEIANSMGADAEERLPYYASNEIGTQEVARLVVLKLLPERYEYACIIYPCAPLLDAQLIAAGFAHFYKHRLPMLYSTDRNGVDAGAYYWCCEWALLSGLPLDGYGSKFALPDERVCDVNTMADWQRAEEMYAALKAAA